VTEPDDLARLLKNWLEQIPHASAAAEDLIKRAGAKGALPQAITLAADDPCAEALRQLLPEARYTARRDDGRRIAFRLPAFEADQGLPAGSIIQTMAELIGHPLENRRQEREARRASLERLLSPQLSASGLPGKVARSELDEVHAGRGRLWNLAAAATQDSVERETDRYWRLLARLEEMRSGTEVVRAVHLGRHIAGDTHWLRPGTRPWRWAAEDLTAHLSDLPKETEALRGAEWCNQVLQLCGVAESLTSVRVLVFGSASLHGPEIVWGWPMEAARQGMPVWLSIAQLKCASLCAGQSIARVTTVENETSFWDLLEREGPGGGNLLVYTEGQANRAVVLALTQLAAPRPELPFYHQGDLDLPGVRILHSLRERTALPIQPECMDAATYHAHVADGIELGAVELADLERELRLARLPLLDLLAELHRCKRRIEQEFVTGT